LQHLTSISRDGIYRVKLPVRRVQKPDGQPLIGHRLLGNTLLCVGDVADGLADLDHAIALYDPVAHRSLATRLGKMSVWQYRLGGQSHCGSWVPLRLPWRR
jgi:hypothetical protein